MDELLFGFFAVLAIGNAFVTRTVIRSNQYDRTQKVMQAALIWIVPIFGALLSWHMLQEPKTERITTDLSDRVGSGDGDVRLESTRQEYVSSESSAGEGATD